MFCIQQTNLHDCGYTCIKMMLANLNKDENYLYLASPFLETENVSLLELKKYAAKFGLDLKASRAIDKTKLDKEEKVPFIAIMKEDIGKHAVYVYKITNKKVYYYDPVGEYKKLKINDFIALWSGDVLQIDKFEAQYSTFQKPELIHLKERLFATFLSFLSGIALVFGIYFISKDYEFYLPIIFLTLMIVIEILLKRYLIVILKRMDKRIEDYYLDIKGDNYYQFHLYFEQYKTSAILGDVTIFSHLFSIIIVALILLINAKINAIYLGANILLAAFTSFIVRPYFLKQENKINVLENELNILADKEDKINLIHDLRELGYSYGERYHAYKYVIYMIQLIIAFILMMVSGVMNVTYIICYFFMEIYLYNALINFLNVEEREHASNLLAKLTNLMEKNS